MTFRAGRIVPHPLSLASIFHEMRSRVVRLKRRWTPVQRYVVRANHEWAIIWIDECKGAFNCQSSYGNYAYIWRSIGNRTLKEFLCGLNFDYFMNKTHPGHHRFDCGKTIAGCRDHIKEARRSGSIDRATARDAWDYLDDCEDHESGEAFIGDIMRCDSIVDLYAGDYCDICRESPAGDCIQFWNVIWPEFRRQIGART